MRGTRDSRLACIYQNNSRGSSSPAPSTRLQSYGTRKEMKIAQVSPLTEAVPPKLYGGTERIVAYLTDELTALGHDVTLFTTGDSTTIAKREIIWPRALRFDESIRDY